MNRQRFRISPSIVIAAALLVVALAIMLSFFERIPIENMPGFAIDWKSLYAGLQGGHIVYKGGSVMIAPWSLPAVVPLGFFSLHAGWGMLALLTATVLVVSVPRRRSFGMYLLSIILLVTSWPAIRQIVDGNFEVLVIAGVLLAIYGYRRQRLVILAAGLLLATAKPQETWLMMIVLGIYLWRTFTRQQLLRLAGMLLIVIVPALLLFGSSWIAAMKGIIPAPGPDNPVDISLWASLGRLGINAWITGALWLLAAALTLYVTLAGKPTLSRDKAGMLIAASLFLSPYAAGDSFLTVLAIGVIPMLQTRPRLGWPLLLLTDLQYVLPREFLFSNGAYYWTGMLILVWAIWVGDLYRSEVASPSVKKQLIDVQQ
jgi:hypothetical protein